MTRTKQRVLTGVLAAVVSGLLLLVGAVPASAQPVTPTDGEGLIHMTARVCGSSASWQQESLRNGLVQTGLHAHWLMRGKTYDIQCSGGASASPAPAAQPPAPAPAPAAGGLWARPLPSKCLSGNGHYGEWHDHGSWGHTHVGADIPAGTGTRINAVGGGTVTPHWNNGNAGNQVVQQIGNVTIRYNHLDSIWVGNGWVGPGAGIGTVGSTGNATGPHLHIEVLVDGRNVNPSDFFRPLNVGFSC